MSHKKHHPKHHDPHHHEPHHPHNPPPDPYGVDLIKELLEDIFVAELAIIDLLCPHCQKPTVHHIFRENPDSSYDEVGLKCKSCQRTL